MALDLSPTINHFSEIQTMLVEPTRRLIKNALEKAKQATNATPRIQRFVVLDETSQDAFRLVLVRGKKASRKNDTDSAHTHSSLTIVRGKMEKGRFRRFNQPHLHLPGIPIVTRETILDLERTMDSETAPEQVSTMANKIGRAVIVK